MTNSKRRKRMDLAYALFLTCGSACVLIGAGLVVFVNVPMDAGSAVGGSMLFSLLIVLPGLLLGGSAFVWGVALTMLLRGPPPLILLVAAMAIVVALTIADANIGSIGILAYGVLAVATSLLWFFRWRRQFPSDAPG